MPLTGHNATQPTNTMNYETLGKHSLGKLIGLYKASASRCNEIVEILEELQEANDTLRLAKEEVRQAEHDGDEPAEIAELKNRVKVYEADLAFLFNQEIDGLQARASNLAGDAVHGSEKING